MSLAGSQPARLTSRPTIRAGTSHGLVGRDVLARVEAKRAKTPVQDGVAQATQRPLKIFTSDPLLGRTFGNRARISVANERLAAGPVGSRVEVIDYDAAHGMLLRAGRPRRAAIAHPGRTRPREADPRFHQQMVYAVAMQDARELRARASADALRFRQGAASRAAAASRTRSTGANAYYRPELRAPCCSATSPPTPTTPARTCPGQTVFTCLSHDIVAHEMTHAMHRPAATAASSSRPTSTCCAFHEGFADIVALFQHFTFPDVLRDQIQHHRGPSFASPTPAGRAGPAVRLRDRAGGQALRDRASTSPDRRLLPDRRHRAPRARLHPRGRRCSTPSSPHLPGTHRRPAPDRDRRHRGPAARRAPARPGHAGSPTRRPTPRTTVLTMCHPGLRLPAARGRHLRRLPAGARHRPTASCPGRRRWDSERDVHRRVPASRHLPGGRHLAGRGRRCSGRGTTSKGSRPATQGAVMLMRKVFAESLTQDRRRRSDSSTAPRRWSSSVTRPIRRRPRWARGQRA